MVCSSRGPSEQHGGKRCRCEGYTSLGTACAALSLPSLSYIFPQKLLWVCRGCRLQQLVNSTHRISCQHNSLSLLEICPCRTAGIDFVQPFFGRLILEIAEMSLNFIMSELLLSFTVQHSLKQSGEPPHSYASLLPGSYHSSDGFPLVHAGAFPSGSWGRHTGFLPPAVLDCRERSSGPIAARSHMLGSLSWSSWRENQWCLRRVSMFTLFDWALVFTYRKCHKMSHLYMLGGLM